MLGSIQVLLHVAECNRGQACQVLLFRPIQFPDCGLFLQMGQGIPVQLLDQVPALGEHVEVARVAEVRQQQEALPYAYVSVEGTVTSIEPQGEDDTLSMATRYLGEEMGKGYAQANAGGESVRVTIRPDRWLTVDYAKAN